MSQDFEDWRKDQLQVMQLRDCKVHIIWKKTKEKKKKSKKSWQLREMDEWFPRNWIKWIWWNLSECENGKQYKNKRSSNFSSYSDLRRYPREELPGNYPSVQKTI